MSGIAVEFESVVRANREASASISKAFHALDRLKRAITFMVEVDRRYPFKVDNRLVKTIY
jgi:hypothetical protein